MKYMNTHQLMLVINELEREEEALYRLQVAGRATEAQKTRRRALLLAIEAKKQRLSSPHGGGALGESIRVINIK